MGSAHKAPPLVALRMVEADAALYSDGVWECTWMATPHPSFESAATRKLSGVTNVSEGVRGVGSFRVLWKRCPFYSEKRIAHTPRKKKPRGGPNVGLPKRETKLPRTKPLKLTFKTNSDKSPPTKLGAIF